MHSVGGRALLACCVALTMSIAGGCKRDPAAREAKFLERGKKLLESKEYARAALEFSNAARVNPKRAETWYQLALADLGAYRTRDAVMALRKTIEVDPKHTEAQLRLSALMVQSRDPEVLEAAVKRLDQVLSVDANQPDALDLLAAAEIKLNQAGDAEKHLRQALARFPGRLKSSAALATLQYARQDFDGADKTL